MSTTSKQFFQLVNEGCKQLSALCNLCEHEKEAIESHSVEQLQSTIKKKQTLLLKIAENIDARNQLLNAQGHTADEDGFNSFLETLPKDQAKAISNAWNKLAELLKNCASLNERNEKIVMRSRKSMDRLLNILQGHTTKTTLYNQTGAKGNYSAQNTLGKA
ncbi:flagella synthesis protein FlgN [Motiliproteus sp. MSK22-1]|uniref:flagella synthesis protein FlgN n=1 Tax=Motiliproteus sp. MSK22-1 TaxID=1897630 RepID=UPI0009780E1F|nr:flagellar protein FlgN [Motiliproteus sp. MSK22-1]OMH29996.1 hypothetical protein BGP75_18880 [Motiliproteus sp. MSK22-1]